MAKAELKETQTSALILLLRRVLFYFRRAPCYHLVLKLKHGYAHRIRLWRPQKLVY